MPPRKKTTSSRKKAEAGPPPREAIPLGMTQDCLMCPFGLLFFALRNTRPEVMEHLTKGAQELLFAFRAVADQAAERWEKADAGLQRISVR